MLDETFSRAGRNAVIDETPDAVASGGSATTTVDYAASGGSADTAFSATVASTPTFSGGSNATGHSSGDSSKPKWGPPGASDAIDRLEAIAPCDIEDFDKFSAGASQPVTDIFATAIWRVRVSLPLVLRSQ